MTVPFVKIGLMAMVVAAITFAAAPRASAASPEAVDKAVERAVAFLYAHQLPDGSWELPNQISNHGQDGGVTAFSTYVLLAEGESPKDPRIQKAINWLIKNNIDGTYALGLRGQVWQYLPQDEQVRKAILRDAKLLLFTIGPERPDKLKGLYTYKYNDIYSYDPSSSQFGTSGVWGLAMAGCEIPDVYWETVDRQWRKNQLDSGGWAYGNEPGDPGLGLSRETMTASGVATLLICQDMLAWKNLDCKGNQTDLAIDKGMKWLSDNFNPSNTRGFYGLYAMERVGLAGGFKYIGKHDWYQEGADIFLKVQQPDGSWVGWSSTAPGIPDTCFGILFLVRGRAPIMINKLQYGAVAADGKETSTWNERPRDCASVVPWVAKQHERHANWQVINLDNSVRDMHDAPILYIAGGDALAFTPEQKAKLKKYVEQGGLILGNADCGSRAFADSFRKLGTELFGYEFAELSPDDVIYTDQMFPRKQWKSNFNVMGLSNGVRQLMVLVPLGDIGRQWASGMIKSHASGFQFTGDLYDYATDELEPPRKGITYVVDRDPNVPAQRPIRIARLQDNSNWNPEPGGWEQLANVMHNQKQADLQVETVFLGQGKLTHDYAVAHLTGAGKFSLNDAQRAELKSYVDAGGTLIIDAAGGNQDFAKAAEKELAAIFPDQAKDSIPTLPLTSPVYSASGAPIGPIKWRRYAHKVLPVAATGPRVQAIEIKGRPAVFFSPEDLSAGLVGQQVDGIIGYQPETATAIMTDLILSAPSAAAAPTTAPSTQPTTHPAAPQ